MLVVCGVLILYVILCVAMCTHVSVLTCMDGCMVAYGHACVCLLCSSIPILPIQGNAPSTLDQVHNFLLLYVLDTIGETYWPQLGAFLHIATHTLVACVRATFFYAAHDRAWFIRRVKTFFCVNHRFQQPSIRKHIYSLLSYSAVLISRVFITLFCDWQRLQTYRCNLHLAITQ